MKQIFTLTFVLFTLLFQSCRDNLNVPTPASRNYEQDVAVLNDFVDINKTTHEYYVNSNKHTSVLSYIKNSAVEELNSVNLLNFEIFNKSLSRINQISEQLISSCAVDYIVMITEDEIYVNRINEDSPVELRQKLGGNYSSTVSSLNVTSYKEQYYVSDCNYIETSVELNPQAYKNAGWAFLETCELNGKGEKENGGVLCCGVGYHINPCFEWFVNDNVDWDFEVVSLNEEIPYIADLRFLRR